MKHTAIKESSEILQRIEVIEEEIMNLKLSVLNKFTPSAKKTISLKGIVKDVDISEEDIKQAKKSLYSKVKI